MNIVMTFILPFLGSIFPAIVLNVNKSRIFFCGIGGTSGYLIYYFLMGHSFENVVAASFAGAIFVGLYSETVARLSKSPATLYSITGIFPLVPGIGAYTTVLNLVEGELAAAASKGIETLSCAGAIAVGIMLGSVVFRMADKLFHAFYSK